MNGNTKKTFEAVVKLGLNLETGKSKTIYVRDIERTSNVRQNSNGMRIIRSDQKPFDCFKISRDYDEETGALKSVTFGGYRDVAYQIQMEKNAIADKKQKVDRLEDLVVQHVASILKLEKENKTKKLYNSSDVLNLLK